MPRCIEAPSDTTVTWGRRSRRSHCSQKPSLGDPCPALRLHLQRILLTLKAANGRTEYAGELVRGLLRDLDLKTLPRSDLLVLLGECEALSLQLCLAPCKNLQDAAPGEDETPGTWTEPS